MNDSTRSYSPRAFLAAVGIQIQQTHLFRPIEKTVCIRQKTVKHTPAEKLYDAFLSLLAGARGLVEINKRLRSDPALQRAFGRQACAEQSVVQETLDACTPANVCQMHSAFHQIYRRFSGGFRHNYQEQLQLLDADLTGMPCGKKCEFASKGYFAHQRHRRGRQLGRVLATRYDEIVAEQLLEGKMQLPQAFRPLVEAAEQTLDLDADKRARTILRVDSGGGNTQDVNWALERGYLYHGKDYSGMRARSLTKTVSEWVDDPKTPGRQVGWIENAPNPYVRPVRRIAVRCRKNNGQWGVGVLISALSPQQVLAEMRQPVHLAHDPKTVLLAYVYLYDQRGGGVETSIKEDKQGLGLTKRNKKRFAAQQVLVLLAALAHNVIVWARNWLAPYCPKLARFGILRMVRDVFTTSGWVDYDPKAKVLQIVLNRHDPLAPGLLTALRRAFGQRHIALNLGET
jgi:hypothetical protein